MVTVSFYDQVEDHLLQFAVIVARYRGQWVFCKHKERNTYECPGGHREPGEDIEETAKRELYEETGAKEYTIAPVCVYSVAEAGVETFGMLYFAEVTAFGPLPESSEMERVELVDQLPVCWTYPEIQPQLLKRVSQNMAAAPDVF